MFSNFIFLIDASTRALSLRCLLLIDSKIVDRVNNVDNIDDVDEVDKVVKVDRVDKVYEVKL